MQMLKRLRADGGPNSGGQRIGPAANVFVALGFDHHSSETMRVQDKPKNYIIDPEAPSANGRTWARIHIHSLSVDH